MQGTGALAAAAFAVVLWGPTPDAQAIPVSVSDSGAITTSGQTFTFSFTGLPSSGTGGQFSTTLNGDYSGFDAESAVYTLDAAGGSLDLGNGTNGIVTNTVPGLSLASFSQTTYSFDDQELTWTFDMSDSLLSTVIADGTINTTVVNDSGVNAFSAANPDFVQVGYAYQSSQSQSVPNPAPLSLMLLGLLAFAGIRRAGGSAAASGARGSLG